MNTEHELRSAAEVLDEAAADVRVDLHENPYWGSADGYTAGVRGGLGGPAGTLAALITPDVAERLAFLLRAAAETWPIHLVRTTTTQKVAIENAWLKLAREINAAAPSSSTFTEPR
jgi:hypothetical protein